MQNHTSKHLRQFALRENDLISDALLMKAQSLETSETQAVSIKEQLHVDYKQPTGDINFMKGCPKKQSSQNPSSRKQQSSHPQSQHSSQSFTTCRNCGKSWPHKQSPWPADGRTCRKCSKPNHFAKMCFTPVHHKRESNKKTDARH